MFCVDRLVKCFAAFCFLITLSFTAGAQLSVTPGATGAALSATLAGPGITISSPVLNCPGIANGTFSVAPGTILGTGTTVFGIGSGVVLTAGKAASAAGPESTLASTNNSAPGDPALVTLSGATTYDACVLEFDVTPVGDTISFNYIFGSEEYVNSTCGPYNDAFAFFISGPGITGAQNMALVPGTTIPVTVNSVNSGIPGPGYTLANCTSMGPGAPFTTYFINNTGGTKFTYKGFTTKLTAVHSVIPCSTYHLKLAVADAGNAVYDSGVFIEAASLTTPVISGLASVCIGGNTALSYTVPGGTWSSSNSAIAAVAAPTGIVTGISAGTASITYTLSTGCFVTKTVTVSALSPVSGAGSFCTGATIALGNAAPGGVWSSANPGVATVAAASGVVTGVAAGTALISYVTGSGCAVSATVTVNPGPGAITGNAAVCVGQTATLTNATPGGTWSCSNTAIATIAASGAVVTGIAPGTVSISYTRAGCSSSLPFTVYPLPSGITVPAALCIGFTAALSDSVAGGTWSISDTAIASVVPSTGSITGKSAGTALVTYTTPGGCSVTATLSVQIKAPDVTVSATDSIVCSGTYATFTGFTSGLAIPDSSCSWLFGTDMVNNRNHVRHAFGDAGMHTVTLNFRPEGCPAESISRNILVYANPVINLGPDTSICPGSNPVLLSDQLNAAGAGAHWHWNTGQSTQSVAVTAPGYYYAEVTVNGCSAADTVWVQNDCFLNLPNAFTPNGDGVNDYFFPRDYLSKGLTTFSMSIYNRWGSLIFETSSTTGKGWDGRLNDVPQPEGVYVYLVEAAFKDGQKESHHGNVTLLR